MSGLYDTRSRATRIGVVLLCLWTMPSLAQSDFVRAAGCYLASDRGVVIGVNRRSGKLQLPIGSRLPGEIPRQTASRETEEETGLDVLVGERLHAFSEGRVVLYRCRPRNPDAKLSRLQPRDGLEVSTVLQLNPHNMHDEHGQPVDRPWRFPDTLEVLRRLFPRRGE